MAAQRTGWPPGQRRPWVALLVTLSLTLQPLVGYAESFSMRMSSNVSTSFAMANDGQESMPREPLPQELLNVVLAKPMLTEPPSTCDAVLEIPKVALLFLTPGKLPHERLWREWFGHATGQLPLTAVKAHAGGIFGSYSPSRLAEIVSACSALEDKENWKNVVDRQVLFTVYVHVHPSFRGFRSHSIFAGRIIPTVMVAKRAHHSLTDAERLLLAEALRERRNQRFLLVSETTLPLYGPLLMYTQMMAEKLSRVNGCTRSQDNVGNLDRWDPRMETQNFKSHHWRKTSQWFGVTREHALVIVNDTEVNNVFQKYCVPHKHPKFGRRVSCSSNEHYPAIVLAVNALGHETTCSGGGHTFVDWSKMTSDGRPRSYRRTEVRDTLLQYARTRRCTAEEVDAALATTARQFITVSALPKGGLLPGLPSPPLYPALNGNCSLFIRKFPKATSRVALTVFRKFIQT